MGGAEAAAAADGGRGAERRDRAGGAAGDVGHLAAVADHHLAHRRHVHCREGLSGAVHLVGGAAGGVPRGAGLWLYADADDGRGRTTHPVQPQERDLYQAAGSAGGVLQPEPLGRSDLAHQQRHRQAQPVLRAGADAVSGQCVPDRGGSDFVAGIEHPARRRGALAGGGGAGGDATAFGMGAAGEFYEPSDAGQSQRRNPGEVLPISR